MSDTTTTTTLTFSSGSQATIPGTPNFTATLPSSLDPGFSTSFNTQVSTVLTTYPISGSFSAHAGLTGGITLSLGNFTPSYPVSVSVDLPNSVQDGSVFSIDPTLVGVNDANFSLMGPGAAINLSLGASGSAGFTFDQGGALSFAANLPFSISYALPTTHAFSAGPFTLTIAEESAFGTASQTTSSVGSLPTLTATGTDNPFLTGAVDLIGLLADIPDSPLAAISGTYGVTGLNLGYSLLSAPLSLGLSLGETVSLVPESIGVVLQEELGAQVLATDSGTLGQTFSFVAPDTGAGTLSINATYTLNYEIETSIGLVGDLTFSIDGPKISGSVLGASFSLGPLGSEQLFSGSLSLGSLYSQTSDSSLTQSATYNVDFTPDICYLAGTRILTPGGEVCVEDLAVGDRVVTRFGGIRPIKWIGRQSYSRRVLGLNGEHSPVCISAGALGPNMPLRDLFVSPSHSMLIDDTLVLAQSLVNGITITQSAAGPDAGDIDYFQLDLGTHDCVIAEGVWSETFADGPCGPAYGLRDCFHNVAEYYELYPDEPPAEQLVLCAPRPERGPALERVLAPVAARAAAVAGIGPLEGHIDAVNGQWDVEGWAMDARHPELPVLLEVFLEDRRLGTVLACDLRDDLRLAGKGSGRCAFRFRSPVKLRPELLGGLSVRRASDGAALPFSDYYRDMAGDTPAWDGLRVVA